MGTHEQKMYIAYRCYDCDNDEMITKEEIKVVLRNIPLNDKKIKSRCYEFTASRYEYLKKKISDQE